MVKTKDMSTDTDRDKRKLIKRNIVIAVLVILFFTGIIIVYYRMLYNEKRNNIVKTGEITAKESADQIERYLTTNIDSVKLAAYTLDEMINEERTDEEIQDYLVGESTAVRNAVIENSTGLYGYINGRFFSGTNWEPPKDYDATERPWYKRPMENPGEITILDPYIDVQSGNMMLALGKTLCDGVSVISVDVSLDRIQNLTEQAVKNGNSDIEMILNDDGMVVAHSDIGEVFKNYHDEKGTLGSEILSRLNKENDYFEFIFNGANYIVYVADIQNEWFCISVKDATSVFGSLNSIMFVTITVVIAIMLIISIIMTRSNRYLHMSMKAIAASDAKSDFLSKMSHEIRTPINAILGMNEMILRESGEPAIREYSENVKTAGRHLLGLVDEMLDYSETGAEKSDLAETEGADEDSSLYIRKRATADYKYHERFTAPDARVLVVDDNPMNIMVFKSLIKQTGVMLDTAHSGDECVKLTEKNRYDMIFLDHMMPEKDGIETLHGIKESPSNKNVSTPVVCLTANAISGVREKYISEGFSDYLAKPVDPIMLEEIMLKYISEDKVTVCGTGDDNPEEHINLPEAIAMINTDIIDTKKGLKNSGSAESYLALLKVFYESIDEKSLELNSFYENKDYKNYTIKVHALKSSARIIGADDFGEEAQRLEDAGKEENIAYIQSHHDVFINRYDSFKKSLEEVFSGFDSDYDKPEADTDLMESVFEEIRAAAEDMDCEMLDSIFAEMGDYRIPAESKELFDKLKDASDKYEYKTKIRLLNG